MTTRFRIRRALMVAIAISGCLGASIEGEVKAQPVAPRPPAGAVNALPKPRAPAAPNLRVQLPAGLRARLNTKIKTKTGDKTVQEVLSQIDGTQTVTLSNGKTMTLQDLTDRVGRAETSANASSGSLSTATVPEEAWAKPTTLQRIQQQDAAFPQRVAGLRTLARVPQTTCTNPPCPTTPIRDDGDDWNQPENRPRPIVPGGCQPTNGMCKPSRADVEEGWSRDAGDTDFVAMDVAFGARASLPDGGRATCTASFNAGLTLLGRDRTALVRYNATENARVSMDNRNLGTGSASLFIGSRQVALTFGENRTGPSNISDSFSSGAEMSVPIIPGISVKVAANGALTLGATLDGQHIHESSTAAARCRERVEPQAKVVVSATGSLILGIGDLVELAEAGVEATLVPIDLRLPTTAEGYVGSNPILARLTFKSALETTYMKGTLRAFYRIADVCWDELLDDGKTCFVRDILGIRTRGSKKLWDHRGFTERDTLADVNRVLPWTKIGVVRPVD